MDLILLSSSAKDLSAHKQQFSVSGTLIVFFILYLGTRCFSVINRKIYCGLPVVWCLCDDCFLVFCCTFMIHGEDVARKQIYQF